MANLNVENLGKIVESGQTEKLFSGSTGASELRTSDVMRAEGLQPSAPNAVGENATTFGDMLRNSVDKVNTMQHQADVAISELVAGRSKNIHETMLSIERADTSLKLMMQVRNKVLDAYKEIMRMQV
ncbi:MAG: flagellar hook-basal body complex protein FliE [Bdellovibrionota bacterium]